MGMLCKKKREGMYIFTRIMKRLSIEDKKGVCNKINAPKFQKKKSKRGASHHLECRAASLSIKLYNFVQA